MNTPKAFKQYLARHAEPQIKALVHLPMQQWDRVICIPAYNEAGYFLDRLITLATTTEKNILLILSINQPEGSQACPNNQRLYLQATKHNYWQKEGLSLSQKQNLSILTIDQFSLSHQIPKKFGVGLARKTACDLAIDLIAKGRVASQMIYSTDADTQLPTDYFDSDLNANSSAGIFPFKHLAHADHAITEATRLYEKSLDAYVKGLEAAQSPYAYHTIGSCLLIDAISYCQVRGFPKRSGAEDFYLLNKLNKIKPVSTLPGPTLEIDSRISDRVPFGTGPAVNKLVKKETSETALFYPEQSYRDLKQWLTYLNYRAAKVENNLALFALKQALNNTEQKTIATHAYQFELDAFLIKLFANFKNPIHRQTEIHKWFDGFKTLKFIRQYATE
ncbi:MAG: hypothetical protein OXE99_13740 [Cellvibrionales bacterium]|nr:hypothetical protein [Cellvibrionales bacterium]